MIRTKLYKSSLFFLFCLAAVTSWGQSTTVKVSADKSRILIGEPIKLTLEADIPESEAIRFFQLDSIPHFEFLEKQKIDTANTGKGTVLTQIIQVTSFDSGHWVIPAFVLIGSLATDSLPVDVGYSDFNPKQPYHDIKDIIEVHPVEEKKTNWWYFAGGGLVLLLIGIYFLTRRRKPIKASTIATIDPYEDAMSKLQEIQGRRSDPKLYYSGLVDIFRRYVNERKGIQSLHETTDGLVSELRALKIPGEQSEALSAALRLSDFVKFAKYIPLEKDNESVFAAIKNAIVTIEKMNTVPSLPKMN